MTDKRFPDAPSGYPFPALEDALLERWRELRIFEQTLEKTADGEPYVFFEGPPTANNVPHIGHVMTRVVKDLFPRFRTMQGRSVRRKAGWDTHGLPVEIEVEKRLGFTGKQDIEKHGVEKFNRACLESVHTYEQRWREMTERVGFWVDLDEAYFTYTNKYIESGWWALATLFDRGLLVKDYKIQPYCARCGTTLSSHEVAQNYKDIDDPSVWVLFPVRPGQEVRVLGKDGNHEETWKTPEGLNIVAWTTTPWTLLGHSGLAINPDLTYRVVDHIGDVESGAAEPRQLLYAEGLQKVPFLTSEGLVNLDAIADPVATAGGQEVRMRGEDLAGLRYERPFPVEFDRVPETSTYDPTPSDDAGFFVFAADYVTLDDGSGIVHTAPAFGEDDYKSGLKHGLPFALTVTNEGKIDDRAGTQPYAGRWFKDADKAIRSDLKARGLLLHGDRYRHNYPFCWRCDQPLLYYASPSWFIRTTVHKRELVELNRKIGWHPAHVGEGRFGNWLENVVDWALSRKRYWGTPLPIWECDGCEHRQAIGSYADLFRHAGRELPPDPYDREQFDPHRPFVDRDAEAPFTWPCAECGDGTMGRVSEVIDAWFDSGAMPFAQHHYPFENREAFDGGELFPANFISEAVDQTRGWFYTLHVLGALLFGTYAYENCIVLGHINDETGRKMSKRLGNVVDPMEVMPETGADALRWYFYINNPELSARFSTRLVREAAQQFLLPIWNALSFFTIYANLDGWHPSEAPAEGTRPALDRWILLRLDRLVRETTEHLEGYRIADAARAIEVFIDELTNWYIRRSRDRFWASSDGDEAGKAAAYETLYEVLSTLSRLIAPFTPFVADTLHGHLVRSQRQDAPASVHLERWPQASRGRHDEELERAMGAVQRVVRLGHAARNDHGLKTRQPLASVTIVSTDAGLPQSVDPHLELLREELNVHEIRWAEDRSEYVHHEVRPIFPICGPRFGKRMPQVKRALEAADGDALAARLESAGSIEIELDGETIELVREEVEVRLIEREGSATQGDRELLVALDTELDDTLIAEGWAREVVHRIQTARRAADLDYADRIRVRYAADESLAEAVRKHAGWISGETLTVELQPATDGGEGLEAAPIEDLHFAFAIEKV